MTLRARRTSTIVTAALALLVAACTIEDASDKRAADSAAAATARSGAQTSASGGAIAPAQPAPTAGQAAPAASATAGDSANAAAGAATAPGATDSAAASGAPGASGAVGNPDASGAASATAARSATPAKGNLSPDSVDVGRTTKATLLPVASTRIEVDLNARTLHVYEGDRQVGSYRVAVGSKQWPTQTGEWSITQVVWNPEWIPPKNEAWAEAKDPKKPGAPDNPLGRAQLVYDPPRTVHGTNEPRSIGKAVSHGSIRLANADVIRLARQLMEVTGVGKDEAWYRQVQQRRTEKVVVDLPQRVPIRVF